MGPKQKDKKIIFIQEQVIQEKEITDRELLCDMSELRKDFLKLCIFFIEFFFPILKELLILEKELNVKK